MRRTRKFLLGELETCRRSGNEVGVARIAEKVRKRLFDLSAFMKELKLKMTLAYNFSSGRSGTLWDGRFRSVLVEPGDALRAVAAYIDLNCRKRLAEWLRDLKDRVVTPPG